MSTQKSILDALATALALVTGVNKVTQDFDVWNQSDPMDYSTLFINPKKPEADRLSFLHPTSADMMATMEIIIEGNIYSQYSSDVASTLDTLMRNVEIAIVSNTALNALVVDIYLSSDEFVSSVQENYGLFSATYVVEYYYNHLSP